MFTLSMPVGFFVPSLSKQSYFLFERQRSLPFFFRPSVEGTRPQPVFFLTLLPTRAPFPPQLERRPRADVKSHVTLVPPPSPQKENASSFPLWATKIFHRPPVRQPTRPHLSCADFCAEGPSPELTSFSSCAPEEAAAVASLGFRENVPLFFPTLWFPLGSNVVRVSTHLHCEPVLKLSRHKG